MNESFEIEKLSKIQNNRKTVERKIVENNQRNSSKKTYKVQNGKNMTKHFFQIVFPRLIG